MSGDVSDCHGQMEDATVMGEEGVEPGLLNNLPCAGIPRSERGVPDVSSMPPVSPSQPFGTRSVCHTFQTEGGFRISVYYGDIVGLGLKSKHETH